MLSSAFDPVGVDDGNAVRVDLGVFVGGIGDDVYVDRTNVGVDVLAGEHPLNKTVSATHAKNID